MTTDRKNFESHEFRAIIMAVKYPGVAYRLGTWFGTKVRLVRLQSLGPKVSEIVDFRDFFFVCFGKVNPRLCRGAERAYSDEKSKQEKVPELK